MDLASCVKELIEKVASQGTDINNIKNALKELKDQQWWFIIALIGFLGKEVWFQVKSQIAKKNGNGNGKNV